jgi:hypothetical protein
MAAALREHHAASHVDRIRRAMTAIGQDLPFPHGGYLVRKRTSLASHTFLDA